MRRRKHNIWSIFSSKNNYLWRERRKNWKTKSLFKRKNSDLIDPSLSFNFDFWEEILIFRKWKYCRYVIFVFNIFDGDSNLKCRFNKSSITQKVFNSSTSHACFSFWLYHLSRDRYSRNSRIGRILQKLCEGIWTELRVENDFWRASEGEKDNR